MNLIRQQITDALRKRIHRNPRRPQHEIRGDHLLDRLAGRFVVIGVDDAVFGDLLYAGVDDYFYFVSGEFALWVGGRRTC